MSDKLTQKELNGIYAKRFNTKSKNLSELESMMKEIEMLGGKNTVRYQKDKEVYEKGLETKKALEVQTKLAIHEKANIYEIEQVEKKAKAFANYKNAQSELKRVNEFQENLGEKHKPIIFTKAGIRALNRLGVPRHETWTMLGCLYGRNLKGEEFTIGPVETMVKKDNRSKPQDIKAPKK